MGAAKDPPEPAPATPTAVTSQLTVALWVALWITLSVSIIIVNKHVLYYSGFHYPLLLAVWHMVLATVTARAAISVFGWTDSIKEHGSQQLYMQLAMIGLLFGGALGAGNAALLFLSVPTVQMLKAGGPATIYVTGILLGTEKLQLMQAVKVLVVCTGVGIASHGDITLTLAGFALQAGSIVMDALRCCFLQRVLQHNKVDATPLVTLAYVAPFSAAGLLLPMAFVEGPKVVGEYGEWKAAIPLVCLSGLLATALNFVVFKIIRLTSALTTSLSGVIKEWICILVAVYVYGTVVTATQWLGYSIAICGLIWYNISRIRGGQQAVAKEKDEVTRGLLSQGGAASEESSVVYVKVQR